jgi:hypothetical protein
MVNVIERVRRTGVAMKSTVLIALRGVIAMALIGGLSACLGGGGGGDDGGAAAAGVNNQTVQAEVDRLFPYVADKAISVTFECGRFNSRLTYYFHFDLNFRFTVLFETDTYRQFSFSGSYSHANGAMRMVADPNNVLALDETTTRIYPRLGILAAFETPGMRCTAVGHGYNDPSLDSFKSYDCPNISPSGVSIEDNAIEFTYSANPFPGFYRGAVFRQREIGIITPIITRGYGIFRRVGDTFYADFWSQFGDVNLLKGTFLNGDSQIRVEQLSPSVGPCNRR